jgi:hypothetical protein
MRGQRENVRSTIEFLSGNGIPAISSQWFPYGNLPFSYGKCLELPALEVSDENSFTF